MPYEIQTYALVDGWTNTWFYQDLDGVMRPETLVTAEQAEAALAEHLDDLHHAYWAGQIEDDDHKDFRICYVTEATSQPTIQQTGAST